MTEHFLLPTAHCRFLTIWIFGPTGSLFQPVPRSCIIIIQGYGGSVAFIVITTAYMSSHITILNVTRVEVVLV